MGRAKPPVKSSETKIRCAIYTRKSTEDGLDQEFNSLDAPREAACQRRSTSKTLLAGGISSTKSSWPRSNWLAVREPLMK